jgi:hypothetical protein
MKVTAGRVEVRKSGVATEAVSAAEEQATVASSPRSVGTPEFDRQMTKLAWMIASTFDAGGSPRTPQPSSHSIRTAIVSLCTVTVTPFASS